MGWEVKRVPEQVWVLCEEKHLLQLPKIEPYLLGHQSCSRVSLPSLLSRFFPQRTSLTKAVSYFIFTPFYKPETGFDFWGPE
jgi:hypothetical protein